MTIENLKYRFDGGKPTQGATAIVGVLGSGNLEVLVEPAALGGACEIEVSTAAQGFGKTWQAVMKVLRAASCRRHTHFGERCGRDAGHRQPAARPGDRDL